MTKPQMSTPLLFTYRRCPYAMRARMALLAAGIAFDGFEIVLHDKPAALLARPPYPYCNCPRAVCWRKARTLFNGRWAHKTHMAGGAGLNRPIISTCWPAMMGHTSTILTVINTLSGTVIRTATLIVTKPQTCCCCHWKIDCSTNPIWAEFPHARPTSRYFPLYANLPRWSQPGF